MKATELAWAAGFFDGEGCTSIKQGSRISLRLSVGQTNQITLKRFQNAVGYGTINGPYKVKKLNWTPHSQWNTWSDAALIVIQKLWKYLSPIKQQQFLTKLAELKEIKCHQ